MFLCQKHTPKLQLRQGFSYSALASPFSSAERLLKITFTRMPTIRPVAMELIVHGTEVQRQAADAAHQNGSDHEQVPVVAQIHRLQHLQAADRDEAVQRDAHAAHDAGGDGVDEGRRRGRRSYSRMQYTPASAIVLTEALPVMATQPTDSP